MSRLWVISELFYPEETSTGYFVTEIAADLAQEHEIRVLCSQPTYSERHLTAPSEEHHRAMHIKRVRSTRFDKDGFLGRAMNLASFTLAVGINLLLRLRRDDQILVLTNPPSLPPIVGLLAKLRGAKAVLLMHDVYPEVLAATGMTRSSSLLFRMVYWVMSKTLNLYYRVVVLGRDMAELTARKVRDGRTRIEIIPNWADITLVQPLPKSNNAFAQEHGTVDKLTIQMSGNLGQTHDIGLVLELAERMAHDDGVLFQFIGYGGREKLIKTRLASYELANTVFLPRQPRERLGEMLASADVAIIPFVSSMRGVSVPSRMYNIMAAGVPIIAVADSRSELAIAVTEENCGWVVPPGDIAALETIVRSLRHDAAEIRKRGERARDAAVRRFSFDPVRMAFRRVFAQ